MGNPMAPALPELTPRGEVALLARILYREGYDDHLAGHITLNRWVELTSTSPAKIFGLYPRKGAIQVGSDADLVVYDPKFTGTFSQKGSYSQVDYNAYEGWERRGRPSVVTVRGEVQARDGEFVGKIGRGQFLQRDATH